MIANNFELSGLGVLSNPSPSRGSRSQIKPADVLCLKPCGVARIVEKHS